MKIVVAPDSFKGSISAKEAALNVKKGILKVFEDANVICVPMADGGEGTVQSMVDATNGKLIYVEVNDPLFRKVVAFYGILGDGLTAVIEMAAASGLPLLRSDERNPLLTSTYGTGELIKHALDSGCKKIIMGIGGSATNDGGQGMAKALGIRFLDRLGNDIGFGGGCLGKLHSIDIKDIDPRIAECEFVLACDVDNMLCGKQGASQIFGPQKGANESMIKVLDDNLCHYAKVIKNDLNADIIELPGSGAAGGLGGGALVFLGAQLSRGVDLVIDAVGLDDIIKDADLVITGEGMMDYQTQFGKTPFGVAKIAKKYEVPVIALVGKIGEGADVLLDMGISTIFSIVDGPMTLEEAVLNTSELLEKQAEKCIKVISISSNICKTI